jgi:ribonuclease HII
VPQARQEKTPGPGQRRARRSSRKRRPSQSPGILRPRAAKSRSSNPLRKSGARLLRFDRRLGARFVAGADEAGRGSLAGPLVVAGVLLDYGRLRDHRVRPLACLNDSKQVAPEEREELFRAVVGCATRISVQVVSPGEIDREGLHRSNLAGLRRALAALAPPAEACLVDGFEHSAAIAAASIVAKVVRDRYMRRAHALYPAFGFASHVGYITPAHSKVVRERGPSEIHRRSFQALCYLSEEELAALSL